MASGVSKATKKDGTVYYRCSITYKNKHISIGSFDKEKDCQRAYKEADKILKDSSISLLSYQNHIKVLPFEKCIILINYRDNHIYIKNPIYLFKGYFVYYLTPTTLLKFENDDLFYYSEHKIIARGGHWYVNDYGMQYNILSRYGIKPFAVRGRDYIFANGDEFDFRYSNVIVINKYHGVSKEVKNGKTHYQAKIHINGDYSLGYYDSQEKAAVAYNKAVDFCNRQNFGKKFPQNYVTEYTPREYADVYTAIRLPGKFMRGLHSIISESN